MDLYTIRNKLNMGIPLTNLNLRVTTYSRVSTEHLEQKKSLQNQVEHFYEYINDNKNWTYIPGYIDEGITGTSDVKRENFMRMIEDAKQDKFDLIITKEISRFSRNTIDSIKYTRLLLTYGVFVLFVNDNINTALPDAELRLTIMASMAQDEIRRLSERVKFGMNRAILKGELLGNNLIYGYKKKNNKLVIIEEEANIIRTIFSEYGLNKNSLSKIANNLNDQKITTREGNKWTSTTISRIIKNPKYKGYYCGKKSEVIDYITKKIKYLDSSKWIIYKDPKRIPKIVNETLWNKANKRLINRKKSSSRSNTKYLYSGKIFCQRDGSTFNRRVFRKQTKEITWICSAYLNKGKKYCSTSNIREKELTKILEELLEKLHLNLNEVSDLLLDYYRINLSNTTNNNLNKEEEIIYLKKDKILELNIKGYISNEELIKRNNELNKQLELLKKIPLKNNLTEIKKSINLILDNSTTKNNLINLILDKILVSTNKESIDLEIYLNIKKSLPLLKEKYTFNRGNDTKCTKRYKVNYIVNYYFKSH